MSSSETTVDHDTIKNWTEARGGRPSIVRTSGGKGKNRKGGVLRLDFAEKEENFEEVSWDEFFEVFEQSHLAFLYQDQTADGKESRFNRFIEREGKAAPARTSARAKSSRNSAASARSNAGSGETKATLMQKAREKNVPGRSRMSKAELEKAVA